MDEHEPDPSAPEPIDELEPIDLTVLFDGDLEDDHDADSGVDGADTGTDAVPGDDAALMARLFAADLADEPASARSTADIMAAARSAAGSVGARPGPPDRRATDELAARRRRRRFVSRGLLAAAAVAVLAVGGVAVIRSWDGGASNTASSATVADGPAYAAPERTSAAAGAAGSAASGSDSGSMLESSAASYSAPAAEPAAPSSAGSSSSGDSATGRPPAPASAASEESRVTVTLSGGGKTPATRSGTQSAGGECAVSTLPGSAAVAAVTVLGGRPSSLPLVAAMSVGVCQDRALSGQVITTADGSRVTVLVAREVGGTERSSETANAATERSATVRSGQVRVLVSTPANSSVTDRQLQQTAAAVLATQR